MRGGCCYFPGKIILTYVAPGLHFIAIRKGHGICNACEHVIEFVLGETIIKARLIDKIETVSEATLHTHFLLQPPVRSRGYGLSRAGMAAAGVGPQAGGVILISGPLLQ